MNLLEKRLAALKSIYAVYDESVAENELACSQKCSACCTTDVTLTTLETYHLWRELEATAWDDLSRQIESAKGAPRFRPSVTTNRLAEICAAGGEPPEEKKAGTTSRCPLLVDDLCAHYPLRPFHCRCMASRQICSEKGSAEMDDFLLALNSVFLQAIEHLDRPGCTGNLLDLLPLLRATEFREAYEKGRCKCQEGHLAVNHPLKVLMIPPDCHDRMKTIIAELRSIRI